MLPEVSGYLWIIYSQLPFFWEDCGCKVCEVCLSCHSQKCWMGHRGQDSSTLYIDHINIIIYSNSWLNCTCAVVFSVLILFKKNLHLEHEHILFFIYFSCPLSLCCVIHSQIQWELIKLWNYDYKPESTVCKSTSISRIIVVLGMERIGLKMLRKLSVKGWPGCCWFNHDGSREHPILPPPY